MKALLEEWGMESCKVCDTPVGMDALEVNQGEEMPKGQATLFRRGAARINYLSQDRPDLNVASRLLAMRMANPRRGDEILLKEARIFEQRRRPWRRIRLWRRRLW